MLKNLEKKYRLQLMKNGVYYLEKDGSLVLNYLDLLIPEGGEEDFAAYIGYRLESTSRELSEDQKIEIVASMRKKLMRFKERKPLVESVDCDKDWLYMPTFLLLSQGGDDRSVIDPDSLKNKYHTSTLPLYDYQRSSCTSSSVSLETYMHIEQEHFELMADAALGNIDVESLFHDQKEGIKSFFVTPSFRDKAEILSTPSGTDVELICSWLGVLRHTEIHQSSQAEVCVFVNGDLEVGSGTKPAADMKHFNKRSPIGETLEKESDIHSLGEQVEVESFYTRDEKTIVYNSVESEERLYQKVKEQVEQDKVVVFHYVHASKTGVCTPSYDMAKKIKLDFGDRVVMIVDAAQMRLRSDFVEQYLELGMNIIVTGSKFIGGSPFSGALLVNERDAKTFVQAELKLPKEYDVYFDQFGVQPLLQREDDFKKWTNWGLFMRWEVALHEMKQFDRIPVEFSNRFIFEWGKRIEKMIEASDVKVNVLKESDLLPSDDSSISNANSIIPFEIECEPSLTQDQLKGIHAKMTQKRFEGDIVCEIGQPVQISTGERKRYALRVALGAKNVIDAYRGTSSYKFEDCLDYLLSNDQKLLNKLFDLVKDEIHYASK